MTAGYEKEDFKGRLAHFRKVVRKYRDFITLAILVSFFIVYPQFENASFGNLIIVILSDLYLLAGLYSLSDRRRQLVIGILLAVPSLLTGWIWYLFPSDESGIALLVTFILFLTYILLLVVRQILLTRKLTRIEISRAIMVYILIGLIFGMMYMLLETFSRGSFMTVYGKITLSGLFYFSFVALSTTGFGDIYAVAPLARGVVIIEMLVGTMYTAVLIGLLVNAYFKTRVSR